MLAATFTLVAPHLTERQRRLLFGAAARALGLWRDQPGRTAGRGVAADGPPWRGRAGPAGRPAGAHPPARGPQSAARHRSGSAGGVGPAGGARHTRGDPGKSAALDLQVLPGAGRDAHRAGPSGQRRHVGRLLKQQGYRLQRKVKSLEGAHHVDRDAQFRYLNEQAKVHLAEGQPVVRVDSKKKELVGSFANGGREWQPSGEPERVSIHDFPDPTLGKAIPYGVYDLGRNSGWVGVGVDHDTAAFAVQTLRRWWQQVGRVAYPQAERLLVTADAGGSNGYRVRA